MQPINTTVFWKKPLRKTSFTSTCKVSIYSVTLMSSTQNCALCVEPGTWCCCVGVCSEECRSPLYFLSSWWFSSTSSLTSSGLYIMSSPWMTSRQISHGRSLFRTVERLWHRARAADMNRGFVCECGWHWDAPPCSSTVFLERGGGAHPCTGVL